MLLEGTEDSRKRARSMLSWDVNNGVSRRAWSGNANAQYQIQEAMKVDPLLKVTLATVADDAVLDRALAVAAGGESPQRKRGSEAAGASASGPNKKAAM